MATAIQSTNIQQQESSIDSVDGQRLARILTAGGLAGAVSRTATAPIDRLKMVLQVNNEKEPKTIQWGLKKIREEGSIKTLFKGNGTNVLKIAPETAIKLAVTDALKGYIAQDPQNVLPLERFICGGLAGGVAQFTIYPMEVIKTRLATTPHGTYSGLMDVVYRIYRYESFHSFYRGLLPNMVGIFPYAGVEISCFEILLEHINKRFDHNPPAAVIMAAGTCSATFAQCISYPFSLIRTRLQHQGVDGAAVKYDGMMNCFRQTIRSEGYRGLYKGLLPNFIKLAPAAGISWLVFEWTKQYLGFNGHSSKH